ncbi:MAG: hypothetical protein WA691_01415 [Thermoplasmata archaeon]
MGEVVDLVIDPLRGERISLELPLAVRTLPEEARSHLGLPDWVDVSDPIVARAVIVLWAARQALPPLSLAVLGGVANRVRCLASNRSDLGLRRALHDIDLACLHKELPAIRTFLVTLHESEGSGLRFFETSGDRIFNSLSEGRRLRLHMVVGQRDSEVALRTVDLLADEFRFCHRFDLKSDVLASPAQYGTLSPALLLLAKLQFIQRVPGEDREKVADRVLAPFGRHDVVIGPEAKDVRDVLALLLDHPVGEVVPDGISPARLSEIVGNDWGLWRTASLNLDMVLGSSILRGLPEGPRSQVRGRLESLRATLSGLSPKRRLGFLGGQWWEEVDSQPSVDGTANVA